MAVDSLGPKGEMVFSATGADDQAADLTTLGEEIVKRGGRIPGTTAERDAFTTAGHAYTGLVWGNTSKGFDERFTGSGWVPADAPAVGGITPVAGFTVSADTIVEKRLGDGMVEVYGSITRTSSPLPTATAIAVMTTGFRPAATVDVPATASVGGDAGPAMVQIAASGNVLVYAAGVGNRKVTFIAKYKAAA